MWLFGLIKRLYACTVFCEIIFLRKNGMRLRQEEWPEPLRVHLIFADMDARNNNYRRHLRSATLYERYGSTACRTVAVIADPVILRSVGDGWLLAGTEIGVQEGRTHEHGQLWLCRPTHPDAPPLPALNVKADLEKTLPST